MKKINFLTLQQREARLAYWFVVPTFAIVFGLVIYPALYNIWISFHEVTLGNLGEGGAPFVGLKNYIRVAKDFMFKDALKATIIYSFENLKEED
jgi:multiple sugar transport system permease protein